MVFSSLVSWIFGSSSSYSSSSYSSSSYSSSTQVNNNTNQLLNLWNTIYSALCFNTLNRCVTLNTANTQAVDRLPAALQELRNWINITRIDCNRGVGGNGGGNNVLNNNEKALQLVCAHLQAVEMLLNSLIENYHLVNTTSTSNVACDCDSAKKQQKLPRNADLTMHSLYSACLISFCRALESFTTTFPDMFPSSSSVAGGNGGGDGVGGSSETKTPITHVANQLDLPRWIVHMRNDLAHSNGGQWTLRRLQEMCYLMANWMADKIFVTNSFQLSPATDGTQRTVLSYSFNFNKLGRTKRVYAYLDKPLPKQRVPTAAAAANFSSSPPPPSSPSSPSPSSRQRQQHAQVRTKTSFKRDTHNNKRQRSNNNRINNNRNNQPKSSCVIA